MDNLDSFFRHLTGVKRSPPPNLRSPTFPRLPRTAADFSEIKGQERARRAMEIAAAGGHNILMVGPPGTGKSMLAKRLPTIMPRMSFEESVEVTKIHSASGTLDSESGLVTVRPFRSPHHTMSAPALVGGGAIPMPPARYPSPPAAFSSSTSCPNSIRRLPSPCVSRSRTDRLR